MKKIITIFVAILLVISSLAQVPQKLSYQAVIRNSSNALITLSTVKMRISILQGSGNGTEVYTETLTPTTNVNGLVSIEFGGGTGFNLIDWANGLYFIKTEIDPTGGDDFTISGSTQILSVPYAQHAKTSDNITGVDKTKLNSIATGAEVNVNPDWNATDGDAKILNKPTGANIGDMLYWNGTGWIPLNVGLPGQFLKLNSSNTPQWSGLLTTMTTNAATAITAISAASGAIIVSDGAGIITSRGVCWSTSHNPTINDSKTNDGAGVLNFSSSITGLSVGTTYYVRAYATNLVGISYGNEISFTTPLVIGDSYQGGIVAYIFQAGDPGYIANETHGIIVSSVDQSVGLQWSNGSYYSTGATANAIGSGKSNTNIVVASQGEGNYAAKLCSDLVLNEYSDWYLPSKDEMTKIYLNRITIGGFANNYYWTSSEDAYDGARRRHFGLGYESGDYKGMPWYVRAIRYF